MCRDNAHGGRRCPNSGYPPPGEKRDALNAKRRAQYAAKKGLKTNNQDSIKNQKSTVSLMNLPLPEPSIKKVKTAKQYGFPDTKLFEYTRMPGVHEEKKEILKNLSTEHQFAVEGYVSSAYFKMLNKCLRDYGNVDRENLDKITDDVVKKEKIRTIVAGLDDYFENNPTSEERVVYRGVSTYGNHEMKRVIKSFENGDVVDFKGYTSTTTTFSCTDVFTDISGPQQYVFEMKTNKGLYISGAEQEVILPRNTRWRMVGSREAEYKPNPNTSTKEKRVIIQLIDEDLV